MTAVTHGADPDALERLADELLHTAERIALCGRRTLDALTELRWNGPDADRARQRWAHLWLAAIRPTSTALAEAAGAAREHARQQRDASSGQGAVGAGPTGATPAAATTAGTGAIDAPDRSDAAATMRRIRDLLLNGPEIATVITAARTWVNGVDPATYGLASDVLGDAGRLTRGGGAFVTGASVVLDGADLVEAVRDGDAAAAVIPGTGLGLTAAAAAGVGWAGPVGAAWGVGTVVGGAINDGIEGTTYGDHLRARNDAAFDTLGVGGLLIVPGNLAVAAWDTLTGGDDGD